MQCFQTTIVDLSTFNICFSERSNSFINMETFQFTGVKIKKLRFFEFINFKYILKVLICNESK